MSKQIRSKQLSMVLPAITFVALLGCQPSTKDPDPSEAKSSILKMKPDRVARMEVAKTALGDLSRIERALKPLIRSYGQPSATSPLVAPLIDGLAGDTPADRLLLDIAKGDCKQTKSTLSTMWETTWKCGLDEKERGRKEIEGREKVDYDKATRTLTYEAKFEIRYFEDLEPREKAYTLILDRMARVTFAAGATETKSKARFAYRSSARLKQKFGAFGSNYNVTARGYLAHDKGNWIASKGTEVVFNGQLFGADGKRGTALAAGEFQFLAESSIGLSGMDADGCMKPNGTWQLRAIGDGETVDTSVVTTETGGFESIGGTFAYTPDHCVSP